ncbi:hypothetical protein QTP86_008056 [Hemibagrus guttatus]|nr:hypothetical protein QTP86_008056 [Hemibagrus guttatus]
MASCDADPKMSHRTGAMMVTVLEDGLWHHGFDYGLMVTGEGIGFAVLGSREAGHEGILTHFLCSGRWLRPSCRPCLPSWDLSVVLDGLLEAPFEPMESASEKFLTLKMALLLALASLRWVRDLQALLVVPTFLEFAPGMSKAILHPRAGYVPKVPKMAGHLVILQAFCLPPHESAKQESLLLLCPVRALRTYVHCSGSWHKSQSLFDCFGSRNKGNLVSSLAHWVVEAIAQACKACGITSPLGVRAHSTSGVTSSSAMARGVPLQEICAAAGWSSPHTFVRFFNLDLDLTPGS